MFGLRRTTKLGKENLLRAIVAGASIGEACLQANVNRAQYNRWQDADPEFRLACDEIRELEVDGVEKSLLSLIKGGSYPATAYYLSSKGKHRGWGKDTTADMSGEIILKVEKVIINGPQHGQSTGDKDA